MAKIPDWINEGLACYFEQAKIDSAGKVNIKPWESGKRIMKELVRKKKFDLKWLVGTSYKKFHKRHEHNHYVESWAIVYFLMKTNQKVFVDIVKNLKSKTGSVDAINQCYKGGAEQLEKDIYNYYK